MADDIERIPANENPWYVLATYHGEQEGDEFNHKLHIKNRVTWNRWLSAALSQELRQKLIEDYYFTEAELTPYTETERAELWEKCRSPHLSSPHPIANIRFQRTKFETAVTFIHFLFPSYTDFDHATFQRDADFEQATFLKASSFEHSTFLGNTYFRHATFLKDAEFQYAAFQMTTDFLYAKFQGSAQFQNTLFKQYAIFDSAAFQSYTFFQQAVFQRTASFRGSAKGLTPIEMRRFASFAMFSNIVFAEDADFTNREFLDRTIFDGAQFLKRAPEFAETTLHEATTWHNVQWPPTPTDPSDALRMADAYAHLRRRANSIQNHEAELDFFAREMRAKRAAVGGASGFLITLYEWSCNFGQSVHLPVFWLLGLLTGLPPVYHLLLQAAGMRGIDPVDLYGFSAASLGGFFGMRKEFVSSAFMDRLPDFAVFLSGCQSVLGAALLFLIGLALRNRFRIK